MSFMKGRPIETGPDGPDKLECYLHWLIKNDGKPPIEQPVNWWSMAGSLYPNISRMALDTLSVPAMLAECEQLFSSLVLPYFSLILFKFQLDIYNDIMRNLFSYLFQCNIQEIKLIV